MRAAVARVALVAVLVPAGAGAQTLSVTEAQALALLTPESPPVRAIRAGVDVARAAGLAAGRWPNPRVTFNREAVAGITENMVSVSQPLPLTGRRGLDLRAAAAVAEAASSRADAGVRRLRADLRLAFADLWVAQAREQELRRHGRRLREVADLLGRREAAGEAAGFDALRAEREAVDVDTDLALAAVERARAQAAFGVFLAVPGDGTAIEAVRTDRPPFPLPAVEELIARAERSRGELVALEHDLAAARWSERAAGRRLIPEPEVVAGTKSSSAAGGDVGSVVSLHVAIPLFDRGRPERAIAEARARQAVAEAEAFQRTLRAQITAWHRAVVSRREIADRYRAAVVGSSDQVEQIAQVSYEAGEAGILELLDAYRTASTARMRQVTLDAAVREAEIELEYVSGWEIP